MARQVLTHPVAFPKARFRALDGATELAVAEAVSSGSPRPARVTSVLSALYSEVAGEACGADMMRRISSAGREWLLQRAALRFQGGADWFEAPCGTCGTRFDLQVSLDQVPRGREGAAFPVAAVETSLGPRRFEAPNGGHEEAFAERGGRSDDPRKVFAAICGLSDEAEAEAIRFDERDLAAIDAALESASPEIADGIQAVCPSCHSETVTRIDPLSFAFPQIGQLLAEVHVIVQAYRWSEAEILALPVTRRRAYASLIRRERGERPLSPDRRS